MKKTLLLFVLLSAISGFADNCAHVNTEQFWDNNITTGFTAQAQTFMAPSSVCSILSDWEFKMVGRSEPGQITFSIYQWGAAGPEGNALVSQTLDWGTQDQTFDITGLNFQLTPGQLYGVDIDLMGYSGQSVLFNSNSKGYDNGYGWFYNSDFGGWNGIPGTNQSFIANFADVPEPGTLVLMGTSLLFVVRRFRAR